MLKKNTSCDSIRIVRVSSASLWREEMEGSSRVLIHGAWLDAGSGPEIAYAHVKIIGERQKERGIGFGWGGVVLVWGYRRRSHGKQQVVRLNVLDQTTNDIVRNPLFG